MKKYGHGKCVFQAGWLSDPELKPWLLQSKDIYSAKCKYCPGTNISLSSMGRQALSSHMKGKKHITAMSMARSPSLGSFFKTVPATKVDTSLQPNPPQLNEISEAATSKSLEAGPSTFSEAGPSSSSTSEPVPNHLISIIEKSKPVVSQSQKSSTTSILKKYTINNKVTEAEIVWTLHSISTHRSNRAAAKDIKLLKHIIPDNDIIQKMQLDRTKVGYMTVFGLAPYFKNEIVHEIEKSCQLNGHFVLSFDESLNKVSQSQQMDIIVRYWSEQKNEVTTRYLTSAFLKKSTAADLLKAFLAAVSDLDLKNLIQISMDGPNVNKKFLNDLQNYFSGDLHFEHKMMNLGSCGLHTLHNAFKAAINSTGWNLIPFLRAIYNFFNNQPARKGTYSQITGSTTFPKKYCSVRWLENEEVAKTAIGIIPNLKKYVAHLVKEKSTPTNQSFSTIQECLKDPLLSAKLAFFKMLSADAQPLLGEFQSNLPLAPFLYTSMKSLVRQEMERFVVPEKITMSLKSLQKENLLNSRKVNIGIGAKAEIGKCKDDVTILRVDTFKHDCRNALKCFVERLLEKSPLNYEATRLITCLDPAIANTSAGQELFEKLAIHMTSNSLISPETAECAQTQFKTLCQKVSYDLKTFKRAEKATDSSQKVFNRLDTFWMGQLKNAGLEDSALARVIKDMLILSHGNAAVERGFSINRECLIENMKEISLISIRTCFDAVEAHGGSIEKMPISKSLVLSCRNASSKYKEALKHQRDLEKEDALKRANKRRNQLLVRELEEKKRKILEEARKEAEKIEKNISNLESL